MTHQLAPPNLNAWIRSWHMLTAMPRAQRPFPVKNTKHNQKTRVCVLDKNGGRYLQISPKLCRSQPTIMTHQQRHRQTWNLPILFWHMLTSKSQKPTCQNTINWQNPMCHNNLRCNNGTRVEIVKSKKNDGGVHRIHWLALSTKCRRVRPCLGPQLAPPSPGKILFMTLGSENVNFHNGNQTLENLTKEKQQQIKNINETKLKNKQTKKRKTNRKTQTTRTNKKNKPRNTKNKTLPGQQ